MDSIDEYIFLTAGSLAAARAMWMRRQRLASFKTYAEKNGYTFREEPEDLIEPLEDLKLFSAQHTQMLTHQEETRSIDFSLEKHIEGMTVQLMQYSLLRVRITSLSRNQNRPPSWLQIRMVCAVHNKERDYPHFSLRNRLGFIDERQNTVHIPDDPIFNQRFALFSHEDKEQHHVRRLFQAEPRNILMKVPQSPLPFFKVTRNFVQLEGRGNVLIGYSPKMTYLKPAVRLMEQTVELARNLQ